MVFVGTPGADTVHIALGIDIAKHKLVAVCIAVVVETEYIEPVAVDIQIGLAVYIQNIFVAALVLQD